MIGIGEFSERWSVGEGYKGKCFSRLVWAGGNKYRVNLVRRPSGSWIANICPMMVYRDPYFRCRDLPDAPTKKDAIQAAHRVLSDFEKGGSTTEGTEGTEEEV